MINNECDMKNSFAFIFVLFVSFFGVDRVSSQVLVSTPITSNIQGEWSSDDPLLLNGMAIKSFALSLDGQMRAKILNGNSLLDGDFEYSIDSVMSFLSIKVKSLNSGLNFEERFSFPLRKRHDGSIELEYKGVGYLYSKINASSSPISINIKPSVIDELESIEKSINKKNLYDGSKVSSNQALQSAKNKAAADPNSCPKGSTLRKTADVRTYLKNQEDLQIEVAAAIEKFTNKSIKKNEAVNLFNGLINQSNEITKWSWGKVTNGTCGPVEITKLIGKSSSTTKNLFNDFRAMIENN